MKSYMNILSGVYATAGTHHNVEKTTILENLLNEKGFTLEKRLFDVLATNEKQFLSSFSLNLLSEIYDIVGDHVVHKPLSNTQADSTKETKNKLKVIKLLTLTNLVNHYNMLLSSQDSITSENLEFVKTHTHIFYNGRNIDYKEISAVVAGELFKLGQTPRHLIKTSTDVLRLCTYLSDGDTTLKTNTKFKKFKRLERKAILSLLEQTININDIKPHKRKWIKLFHGLHVGDYASAFPACNFIANMYRNRNNVETKSTIIENLIQKKEFKQAADWLASTPTMFVRRLDKILRESNYDQKTYVINKFKSIVHAIDNKVLIQLIGFLKTRVDDRTLVTVVSEKSAKCVSRKTLGSTNLKEVLTIATQELFSRQSNKKVFVEQSLSSVLLPSQSRSFSKGSLCLGRGSRIHFPVENTIRLFCYWIGRDIDLSSGVFDENLKYISDVSYYNTNQPFGYHSGDITDAPNGASEFIDIDTSALKEQLPNARYISVDLRVYSGPTFKEHEQCFLGIMNRLSNNDHSQYNPLDVLVKMDVTTDRDVCTVALFDINSHELVWLDIGIDSDGHCSNNLMNNAASEQEILQYFAKATDFKLSIGELSTMLYNRVYDKEIADVIIDHELISNPAKLNSLFL